MAKRAKKTPRDFEVLAMPQRTSEWFAARAGHLTGSRAKDMWSSVKSGEAAKRRDYRFQLVAERLTGTSLDGDTYVNKEMQRGIDCEPLAFAAYEAETRQMVDRSGFVRRLDVTAGASLDGHVDDFAGLIELKCPKTATHVGYLRGRAEVPSEHLPQVIHALWVVTSAQWCDFVSFDDRLGEGLELFVARVTRAQLATELVEYDTLARTFLKEVEDECAAVAALRRKR